MEKKEGKRRNQVRSTNRSVSRSANRPVSRPVQGNKAAGNPNLRKIKRTKKKKGSKIYIFFLVILIVFGVGIGAGYLRSKLEPKALETAWKDGDEEAFRALFTDPLDTKTERKKKIEKEGDIEEKTTEDPETEKHGTEKQKYAGEENIRYISEEEYRSIVRVYEETEGEEKEPDLLKTMMEYGTLKIKTSDWDTVTLHISVPDITILIEEIAQENISQEKGYIGALIDKIEANSSNLIMRETTVTLEKGRKLGKTAYLLSEELVDGIYGGLLSGFSDIYEEYYKALGGAVR